MLNGANTGYLTDSDGNYLDSSGSQIVFTDTDGSTVLNKNNTLTDAQATFLESKGKALGGALFSNSSTGDDTAGITAANISISQSWSSGKIGIQNSFVQDSSSNTYPTVGSSDNSNILHIIALMDGSQDYIPERWSPTRPPPPTRFSAAASSRC